jgi:transcriptional antiterminator NusG
MATDFPNDEAPEDADKQPAAEPAPAPTDGPFAHPEEAPADEAPADEAPADEAPADEAPADEASPPAEAAPAPEQPAVPDNKKWYVVKVQSGREESIREAIERRVKIEGLQEFFGQIIIPVERVTEMSRGKRVVKERKLYPGYLMVNLEFNDRMLYLFRETSGVGDFVGGSFNKPPPPMSDREVERLIKQQLGPETPTARPDKAPFEKGDHVKVKDGTFAGMEGSVKDILEHKGAVVVVLTIFGRPVDVELEYWQVDEA